MANLNIRVDDELKQRAELVLDDIGMSLTTATNVFLRQVVKTGGIPFELTASTATKETLEALREADDIKKHPERYPSYASAHEMVESFLAEMEENESADD